MKKIITAIGNEKLNQKLREEDTFEIMTGDIQYKEGVLEFLEKENNIDFLILSELLSGKLELKELIEKIKIINSNIQIILFLEEKNQELENYLYAKGIYSIFYHNQIEVKEIIELIKNNQKNENSEIKQELNELKKILMQKEKMKKVNFIFHKQESENKKELNQEKNKNTIKKIKKKLFASAEQVELVKVFFPLILQKQWKILKIKF